MARIYFRLPQCCQLTSMSDKLSLRQGVTLSCGIILLLIITIIFIHGKLVRTELQTSGSHGSLPSAEQHPGHSTFSYGPDVHYGIVLDCGSSGSRVYVYVWPPHSGNPMDLLNIQQLVNDDGELVSKKVTPGLATFEDNPENASEYLKPLLQYAASHIPSEHHPHTLLYILATAGMRMIPEEAQQKILHDLQKDIPKDFEFVISENNFEVISGKQEGVYAWIAVNYILQRFGHGDDDDQPLVAVDIPGENGELKQHVRRRTVGMIDMGGGSMQIAYELTTNFDQIPKHLIAEFNLGCRSSDLEHTYRVYVTTFLGYGANEGRSRYEEMLIKEVTSTQALAAGRRRKRAAITGRSGIQGLTPEGDDKPEESLKRYAPLSSAIKPFNASIPGQPTVAPVIEQKPVQVVSDIEQMKQIPVVPVVAPTTKSPGTRSDPFRVILDPCLQVGLTEQAQEPEYKDVVTFRGTGNYELCRQKLVPLLNLSMPCELGPCSMNGVHQPTIHFQNSIFYGFSEFWYTMEDVYRKGGVYEASSFDKMATDFCGTKWSMLMDRYNKKYYPKADQERFRMNCFKSAWLSSVLHKGLKFPETYSGLTSVQFINKKDVQWTLGALIHRTRYLPLREIEQMHIEKFKRSWIMNPNILYNEYLLVICFIVVVMAILLYVKRLRLCSSKSISSDLGRVPSMSYFMTDMDQVEQGVRYAKTYSAYS